LRERDTKKQKTKMKKLIMKLLGLNTLVNELALLKKQNEEFTNRIKHLDDEVNALEERVQEKIDEIEGIDTDDFVREDDINDRIETYINDNDIVSQSYVDDEIESKVSDAIDDADIDSKIESAIEDLDIDEKVRDLFNDASPSPMSEDDIRKEVLEAVKVTLEKMVKALADQQG
jgi:predicted nuclease with TOPRIM domain